MALTRTSSIDGVPVVSVVGEIDLKSADTLRVELGDGLATAGPFVVVDLSEVTFIDSSGLKALEDSRQRAAVAGTSVALACGQERLIRLLRITGLDTRFTVIAATAAAAVRSGPSVG